ncbi:FkbM family methyltransferase [Alsobacter sp. R-9]
MWPPPRALMVIHPLDRWVASLWKRWAELFKHRYSVEKRLGAFFLLDRKNSVDRNLLIKGQWEPRQLETFERLIRERRGSGRPTMFLDIGAHGALYSILFKQAGLLDEVIAFEPDPVNVAQLRGNLFLNGLVEDIRVIQAAASDAPGRITFHMASETNRGGSRLGEQGEAQWVRTVEVEAVRVDDAIPAKGAFIAAKIDVEGYELLVLSGMTRILAENDCLLQIESFEHKADELIAWMDGHGYGLIGKVVHDHYFAPKR